MCLLWTSLVLVQLRTHETRSINLGGWTKPWVCYYHLQTDIFACVTLNFWYFQTNFRFYNKLVLVHLLCKWDYKMQCIEHFSLLWTCRNTGHNNNFYLTLISFSLTIVCLEAVQTKGWRSFAPLDVDRASWRCDNSQRLWPTYSPASWRFDSWL
jgi:hypothetical protein